MSSPNPVRVSLYEQTAATSLGPRQTNLGLATVIIDLTDDDDDDALYQHTSVIQAPPRQPLLPASPLDMRATLPTTPMQELALPPALMPFDEMATLRTGPSTSTSTSTVTSQPRATPSAPVPIDLTIGQDPTTPPPAPAIPVGDGERKGRGETTPTETEAGARTKADSPASTGSQATDTDETGPNQHDGKSSWSAIVLDDD